MALLHRDRTETETQDDTVAGAVPAWPTEGTTRVETDDRVVRKNSFGQTLRTVIATVLLVAVVAVAIANTDQVDIDLLFDTVDTPLSALVGVAAGAGFLIGVLFGRHRKHS